MDFLNILALILIACGAFTGLVIVTEITFNLFFIIKDRLMPFLTGEKRNRKKIMMPVMMSKEQKSDIPTYEELKHENDLLKKERLRMKAHMDRLHGIMDTLLAVKTELERKLMIGPESPGPGSGAGAGRDHQQRPFSQSNLNTNSSLS